MTDRDRLRALVEGRPDSEDDPVLKALRDAPSDDEPLTEEDLAALEEAYEDLAHGRVVAHEEARRRLLGELDR